jgi:hypothetical protein
MRKYIVEFMLVCLVSSFAVPAFASEGAADGGPQVAYNVRAVSLLNGIGVLPASWNSAGGEGTPVSRAEFVSVLVKIMAPDMEYTEGMPFYTDVDKSHPYVGALRAASTLRRILGSGAGFSPDEPVSYEQALKMLAIALGYDVQAGSAGGYPTGYLSAAAKAGVTAGVSKGYGDALNRADSVLLFYNTLRADYLEQTDYGSSYTYETNKGRTLLTTRFDVYKGAGTVTGNHATTLTAPTSGILEDEVEIGGTRFKTGATGAYDMLGYNTEYYYREDEGDETKTLVCIWARDINKLIYVSDDRIVDYSGFKFTYLTDVDSVRNSYLNVKKDVSVVYNGRVKNNFAEADLKPVMGEVSFLDNDGDSVYDVAIAYSYDDYLVEAVSYDEMRITDVNSEESSKILDIDENSPDVIVDVYKNGQKADFGEISQNDVLSVYVSADGKVYTVVISSERVQGKLEQISSDGKITVNGKEYTVAGSYKKKLKLDTEGTFYLDASGKVAGVTVGGGGGRNFGFLVGAVAGKGLDVISKYEIVQADGTTAVFKSAERVNVNGVNVKGEAGKLPGGTDIWDSEKTLSANAKIIAYKTNGSGEITELDTYTDVSEGTYGPNYGYNELSAAPDDDNLVLKYSRGRGAVRNRYFKTGRDSFVHAGTLGVDALYLKDGAVIFNVPVDSSNPPNITIESKKDIKTLTPKYFENNLEYMVEGYCTDSDTVDVVVLYRAVQGAAVRNKDAAILIDHVSNAVGEDGEEKKIIYGMRSGTEFSIMAEPDSDAYDAADSLKYGDLIVVQTNTAGDAGDIYKLFNYSQMLGTVPSSGTNANRTVLGTIVRNRDNILYVKNAGGEEKKYPIVGTRVYKLGAKLGNLGTDALTEGKQVLLRIAEELIKEAVIFSD